jgi:hypothetical protein
MADCSGKSGAGVQLRDEALMMLERRGAVLETAREVSSLLRDAGIHGAVIGGVAVVLHGYVRTSKDVGVLVARPWQPLAERLAASGFTLDSAKREFVKERVAVRLVAPEQAGPVPSDLVEIDGVTTVPLADLISLKLRSGSENHLRAIDLADVIGLIRHRGLTGAFASRVPKDLRPAFRRYVRLIQRERGKQ